MNTRASVAYGWGILCLAGGGAYYFAKRSINADREERAAAAESRRQNRQRLRDVEPALREDKMQPEGQAPEKSQNDNPPPPAEHAQDGKSGEQSSSSKFEAKEPWRSRKGDRFS